jgi:hypothetical protein
MEQSLHNVVKKDSIRKEDSINSIQAQQLTYS